MNWNMIDELTASLSRPYIAIACGTAVAGSCFIPASAPIAIPVAGGVVAAYMAARTMDKNIAAKAATEDKRTAAMGGPTAPLKTEEVS